MNDQQGGPPYPSQGQPYPQQGQQFPPGQQFPGQPGQQFPPPPYPAAYPSQFPPAPQHPPYVGPPPHGQQPGPQFAGPPPAGPPKSGVGRNLKVFGLAVLLVGGCLFGINRFGGDDNGSGSGDGESLSSKDYAAALAASDATLRKQVPALTAADHTPMVTALRAEADRLDGLKPPQNAVVSHASAVSAMREFAETLSEPTAENCRAPMAPATLLDSASVRSMRRSASALATADAAYRFGGFIPPEAPAPKPRKLANGTFVKALSAKGDGSLELEARFVLDDTTISLVREGGKSPAFTVYLRGGGRVVVDGIPRGTYEMFTASGRDWDPKAKGFTAKCSLSKLDDTVVFDSRTQGWSFKLNPTTSGNASTSDVDPGAFPVD